MQVLVIIVILAVVVHDSFDLFPLVGSEDASAICILTLGPMAALLFLGIVAIIGCVRAIDRTGSARLTLRADRILAGVRIGIVVAHCVGVLVVGWLELARRMVGGDAVFIDEALACAPALAGLILTWAMIYPIDRRIHEAVREDALLDGHALPAAPGVFGFVFDHVRHQLVIILLPISIIAAWGEGVRWLARRAQSWTGPVGEFLANPWAVQGLQFAGVLVVILGAPVMIRLAWSTRRLPPGPVRERLEWMCRAQGVTCRDILLWRTRGLMLNGAVIGLARWVRYILLTDGILERLPADEVEAVMAHEMAHARYRHLPWLMAAMIASISVLWILAWMGAERVVPLVAPGLSESAQEQFAGAVSVPLALAAGFVIISVISRRFEWQADAFAVKHLSGARRGERAELTAGAAQTMAGALLRVARLNHLPIEKFSWRHGSIRGRVRRIRGLIGNDSARLRIDRQVRIIKVITAIVFAGVIVSMFFVE